MGTSYSAICGFGIILDTEKLAPAERRVQHSCDHPERVGQSYCPKCGKAVRSWTQQYSTSELTGALWEASTPKGYICSTNQQGGNLFFVGWGQTLDREDCEEDITKFDVPDKEEILGTIRDILVGIESDLRKNHNEDLEIVFDPETYGFYAFMQAL